MDVGQNLHCKISAHRRPSPAWPRFWSWSQLTELPLIYREVGILSTLLNEEEWKIINANMYKKKKRTQRTFAASRDVLLIHKA